MSRQDPKFDKEQFWTRVHALYASWNSSPKIWRDQDAFVLLSGKQDENILYQRTLALFLWLTGYELFETLVVFTEKSIYVVASSKKSSSVALAHLMWSDKLFAALGSKNGGIDIHLLNKEKENNEENFSKIVEAIRGSKAGVGWP